VHSFRQVEFEADLALPVGFEVDEKLQVTTVQSSGQAASSRHVEVGWSVKSVRGGELLAVPEARYQLAPARSSEMSTNSTRALHFDRKAAASARSGEVSSRDAMGRRLAELRAAGIPRAILIFEIPAAEYHQSAITASRFLGWLFHSVSKLIRLVLIAFLNFYFCFSIIPMLFLALKMCSLQRSTKIHPVNSVPKLVEIEFDLAISLGFRVGKTTLVVEAVSKDDQASTTGLQAGWILRKIQVPSNK
jgi:hypothetical protein